MRTSAKVVVAAAVPVLATGTVAFAAAQQAAAYPNGGNGDYIGQGINIRSAPHLNATVKGLGYHGQGIHASCYKAGDTVTANGVQSNIWILHQDAATGVSGDSSIDYLTFNGIPGC